jgi:hypothetical protein
MEDYLAALIARVEAGNATKEEQEVVAKALRERVDAQNIQYIRSLDIGRDFSARYHGVMSALSK